MGTVIVSFIFLLNMFLGIAVEIISNTEDEILNRAAKVYEKYLLNYRRES